MHTATVRDMVAAMLQWIRKDWRAVVFGATVLAFVGVALWVLWASFDPYWASRLKAVPDATGTFLGPLLGLLAILFGALFNAELNRRRDERETTAKKRSLAAALEAEITAILDDLIRVRMAVEIRADKRPDTLDAPLPEPLEREFRDYARFEIFEANADSIGLLGPEIANKTVVYYRQARTIFHFYAGVTLEDSYTLLGEILEKAVLHGRELTPSLRILAGLPPRS